MLDKFNSFDALKVYSYPLPQVITDISIPQIISMTGAQITPTFLREKEGGGHNNFHKKTILEMFYFFFLIFNSGGKFSTRTKSRRGFYLKIKTKRHLDYEMNMFYSTSIFCEKISLKTFLQKFLYGR